MELSKFTASNVGRAGPRGHHRCGADHCGLTAGLRMASSRRRRPGPACCRLDICLLTVLFGMPLGGETVRAS
jgi:hypothetical protein